MIFNKAFKQDFNNQKFQNTNLKSNFSEFQLFEKVGNDKNNL